MLRIVHPFPEGQGTDPLTRRKGRPSPIFSLTADEDRHARTAFRTIAAAYGGYDVLAGVLGARHRAQGGVWARRGKRQMRSHGELVAFLLLGPPFG